ncbi:pyruvyl transferase 1 [Aplysia californica]|uniref:Pyruvyl transferase 1 n=1 Tax=Aplysia californica TaxID=6500 RepID=A0ABM0JXB2_APLCA|nr:pyruvyl transferase 1 [Aplysia californica]
MQQLQHPVRSEKEHPSLTYKLTGYKRFLSFKRMLLIVTGLGMIGVLASLSSSQQISTILKHSFKQSISITRGPISFITQNGFVESAKSPVDPNPVHQTIIESSTMKSKDIEDFLSLRLLDHPLETDVLSKTLKSNEALILEAQRILLSMLRDLLGKARHVMLFEIATYSNKGDPAISVGEAMLLRKLNVTVVYYCETHHCTAESVERARKISESYEQDELVILMQGGGNLVGYHGMDIIRERVLDAFPTRTKVLFSQSIWLNKFNHQSLKHCQKIYSNRTNFVMFLRDRQSLGIAQENFKGIKHVLAPDMAFGIGMLPRQLPPAFDVIWLKRGDGESPGYTIDDLPKNISFTYHVSDYLGWKSNRGATDMETSFLIATAGLQFLQRGRVLITDRLHGHILSTLLNIPHVLLDNPPFLKLSSFHKTWTASQSNVVMVTDKHQAVREAQKLLERYDSVLPKVGPFMSKKIWEH